MSFVEISPLTTVISGSRKHLTSLWPWPLNSDLEHILAVATHKYKFNWNHSTKWRDIAWRRNRC